jgi:hypothetical protein
VPRYIVVNENTLAYVDESHPLLAGVLASSVIRGGCNPVDGPVHISPLDQVRTATLNDFDSYRVDARGHLTSLFKGE